MRLLLIVCGWTAISCAHAVSRNKEVKVQFAVNDRTERRIAVRPRLVGEGFELPTDMQFFPTHKDLALVIEKNGGVRWLNITSGQSGKLLSIDVETISEQGLLGLAFHPEFKKNHLLYLNYVIEKDRKDFTRVAEFKVDFATSGLPKSVVFQRAILDVEQPYPNHNAGQVAFGPDGYLYIGYGDGGSANDPHGHGQNLSTLLGSMVRIDIDGKTGSLPYRIPDDNPFLKNKSARGEIWAYGLRNPWRFTFDPKGRLVVADVGQNSWEEISFVVRGGNHGWNIREGFVCFRASSCRLDGLFPPLAVYPSSEGRSITGGYVYTGKKNLALNDKYIFSDYVSRKVWAIDLPENISGRIDRQDFYELGTWDISIASFAQDTDGEVYALDLNEGGVYLLDAGKHD